MTSQQIMALLRSKHSKDVFVSECKDGPTQFGSHFRMDAWTMAKSWAHPVVRAYEVKVSRGDFLQDDKWRAYLKCCNQFAFVCPRDLIHPGELPAEVGLYYVSTNARMLVTKRKPVHRDVIIPESVWRYILMCRVKIFGETTDCGQGVEYWREWLATKEENRIIGYGVAKGIRQTVDRVKKENEELREAMRAYDGVKSALAELGFSGSHRFLSPESVRRQAQRVATAIPESLVTDMDRLIRSIQSSKVALEAARVEATKKAAGFTIQPE